MDPSSDNLNPLTDKCICNPSKIRQNSPYKVTDIGSNRQETISNDLHTHVPAFKRTCTHMHTHQYTQDCKRMIALLTGNPSFMKQPQSMTLCVLSVQPSTQNDFRRSPLPLNPSPRSHSYSSPGGEVTTTPPPFCPMDLPFPGWLMDFTSTCSF